MRTIKIAEFDKVSGGDLGTPARYVDGKLNITDVIACGGAVGAVIYSSGGAAGAAGASAVAACTPVANQINQALQSMPASERNNVSCGLSITGGLGPGKICRQ